MRRSDRVIEPVHSGTEISPTGLLIVNADDWGRDQKTTDRTLDCLLRGTVSSVSAMVFMDDSDRAAALAQEHAVDAGLHLNLTTPFSARNCRTELAEHQDKLSAYLQSNPFSRIFFNPFLVNSFKYVVAVQLDEYHRLYGTAPNRLDGHHHMHLCANVLGSHLLPLGKIVRRNFSFQRREKSMLNRLYRRAVDRSLYRRHTLVDFLFPLAPVEPADRLQRVFSLARRYVVEVETHPVNPDEYGFLAGGEIVRQLGDVSIASCFGRSRS